MIAAELVDHILSFLQSEEDYATLETCSLTFPQIADRHLYSHITFYAPDPTDHLPMTWDQVYYAKRTNDKGTHVVDPTQFSHLLIDRPHISNCVRIIRIIASCGPDGEAQPTVQLLPVISSVLSNLSQIESIAFSSRNLLSWSALDPAFCTALQDSIQLPSIKQVAISEINGFPLDTFHSCENLRSLLLYNQSTAGVDVSASSYPRLHSLRVDQEPHLSRIVPWMRKDTLHTLSLNIWNLGGLSAFWDLIHACSASLVNLELDHKYCNPPWNHPFETPIFRELRLPLLDHIIFRSPVLMPMYESFFSMLISFLGSIKTISPISPIRLIIHLQFQRYHSGELPPDSSIPNLLLRPIFRHPIKLYIEQHGMDKDVPSSLGEHPDLGKMLADGKLIIICDEEYNRNVRAR